MSGLDVSTLGLEGLLEHEWLAVNHIGGYACSTAPSLNTRKYHGLLVAAMSPPVRRMVLLSRVEETVTYNGWPCALSANEYPGTIHPQGQQFLKAFNTDPFPRWAYQGEGWTLEKSLRLIRGENTVVLSYTMLAGAGEMGLELRPLLALRGIHELSYQWNGRLVAEPRGKGHYRVGPTSRTPEVFFAHDDGGAFDPKAYWYLNSIYRREQERGYAGLEDLWSPGAVQWKLTPGRTVHFIFSTEPVDAVRVLREADRQVTMVTAPPLAEMAADRRLDALMRAVEQHVVTVPKEEHAAPSVISEYPWAPPSGRWALVGFTGLVLVPGRHAQARALLERFAGLLERGIMPSDFPEDGTAPLRRGADVSLWFVNAAHQYLRYTRDEPFVRDRLWDAITAILDAYLHGTDLGIQADPDGLVASHVPGQATTWMDAKAGDWVITPRAGRAVEINALWYNALSIAAELARRFGPVEQADAYAQLASKVRAAFNVRFWNEAEHCCYDAIDEHGRPDPAIRPNQLLAISLPFPVLEQDRQRGVLQRVQDELLTPMGVRTLGPRDPSYQGRYGGNVVSRDRAYHQGSAFPWLLGPMVSAFVRVHGRGDTARAQALRLIDPALEHLQSRGMGTLNELFDGDAPHRPGGAIASAAGVAEILRAYVEDILNRQPAGPAVPVTRLADLTLETRKIPTVK